VHNYQKSQREVNKLKYGSLFQYSHISRLLSQEKILEVMLADAGGIDIRWMRNISGSGIGALGMDIKDFQRERNFRFKARIRFSQDLGGYKYGTYYGQNQMSTSI
jgi:hypothetical protein